MSKFLVFNVGCIECGVSSNVVGVFTCREEADRIASTLADATECNWRQGGQNDFEVFELGEDNVVTGGDEPYRSALNLE